ncbi:E3 ubiquitin-protein ligase MARCHF2-like isoform X1 [Schistocerca piceifrons]|uniref:E3 ubiquitin-protein ligase MARCHF2-like isoform X1 n=1 Tax=Schistocerca piceifrons TaxID=274613 RepID=UPI001F5FF2F5|nr:E3 ubiquitin-protein ligase MARCHF2-like isoform X1 [Schistocerca piceifrons]
MDGERKGISHCNDLFDSPNTPQASSVCSTEESRLYVSPIVIQLQQSEPNSTGNVSKSLHSTSSSSSVVCRICHDDDKTGMLICPCDCLGALGLIHISCLEKWLSTSNTDKCEICQFRFKIVRKPGSFSQWLKSNDKMGAKTVLGDLLCLALLTPLSLASVYICSFGAFIYMSHGAWEGVGLAVVGCFLLMVFLLWCGVTARYHWKLLKEWQRKYQTVHVLLTGKKTLTECIEKQHAPANRNATHHEDIEMSVFV